jgi:hypothetical protein
MKRHGFSAMNGPGVIAAGFAFVFITSCGGITTLSPTGPSSTRVPTVSTTAFPTAPAPAASLPTSRLIRGTVGPLLEGTLPCFADRYACEVYDFSLLQEGSIEVTVTWEGPPRAMMVQLYWAGEGLAHEDVAPRNGPSRISFQRPQMEAANYRLRVVSLEPGTTSPFTLALAY